MRKEICSAAAGNRFDRFAAAWAVASRSWRFASARVQRRQMAWPKQGWAGELSWRSLATSERRSTAIAAIGDFVEVQRAVSNQKTAHDAWCQQRDSWYEAPPHAVAAMSGSAKPPRPLPDPGHAWSRATRSPRSARWSFGDPAVQTASRKPSVAHRVAFPKAPPAAVEPVPGGSQPSVRWNHRAVELRAVRRRATVVQKAGADTLDPCTSWTSARRARWGVLPFECARYAACFDSQLIKALSDRDVASTAPLKKAKGWRSTRAAPLEDGQREPCKLPSDIAFRTLRACMTTFDCIDELTGGVRQLPRFTADRRTTPPSFTLRGKYGCLEGECRFLRACADRNVGARRRVPRRHARGSRAFADAVCAAARLRPACDVKAACYTFGRLGRGRWFCGGLVMMATRPCRRPVILLP